MSKIPTIAMIPSGYKANKLYSVLPTNGDGDLTTARTSTATRINEIGLIEDVATGVPRLDYTGGGCPSYLIEPASTNLFTYSEDFSNWSKDASTISSDSILSPKGDLTADTLVENGASATHSARQLLAVTSGNDYVISVFVKATSNPRDLFLQCSDAGIKVYFDTTNWVVGDEFLGTGKVDNFGNGWYRLSALGTATSTGNDNVRIGLSDGFINGNDVYLGNSVNGMYLWGGQFEELSYATSYIPTTGTTVTRVAETCSKTGLTNYINSSEGVLYLETKALADDGTNRYLAITDSTTNNYIYFRFVSTSNTVLMRTVVGSSTINTLQTAIADTTAYNKFALKWKSGDYALWVNGVEVLTDTSSTIFSGGVLNTIEFNFPSGGDRFLSKTKDLRVFNEALSDSELTTLTT